MNTAKIIQKQMAVCGIIREEPNCGAVGDTNYFIKDSQSFDYKTSITGRLEGNNRGKEVEFVVWLKHLSNFWKTIGISFINCKINLILTYLNCVITSKATRHANPDADPAVAAVNNPTTATFKTKDTKLYVPVVTLSTEDDNKLLEQLKTRFKRPIKWNKYKLKCLIWLELTI